MRTWIRLGLVLALVIGLAACGGDVEREPQAETDSGSRLTKDEYVAAVRLIESTHGGAGTRLYTELAAGDSLGQAECLRKAKAFQREVDAGVSTLAALEPPEEVDDLHRRLVASIRRPAREFAAAALDIEGGTLTCGAPLNAWMYDATPVERIDRILVEYKARGYLFGSNSE